MHHHALPASGLCCFALWSFVLACGPSAHDERCDDVTEQIEAALQNNIDKGVLVGTAVGCELTAESFDPRVQPSDLEYLLSAFQNACEIQAQECSGISTHPRRPSSEPSPFVGTPAPLGLPPPPNQPAPQTVEAPSVSH